jgi:hypothetical protein
VHLYSAQDRPKAQPQAPTPLYLTANRSAGELSAHSAHILAISRIDRNFFAGKFTQSASIQCANAVESVGAGASASLSDCKPLPSANLVRIVRTF